jgi:hypothetical protein
MPARRGRRRRSSKGVRPRTTVDGIIRAFVALRTLIPQLFQPATTDAAIMERRDVFEAFVSDVYAMRTIQSATRHGGHALQLRALCACFNVNRKLFMRKLTAVCLPHGGKQKASLLVKDLKLHGVPVYEKSWTFDDCRNILQAMCTHAPHLACIPTQLDAYSMHSRVCRHQWWLDAEPDVHVQAQAVAVVAV